MQTWLSSSGCLRVGGELPVILRKWPTSSGSSAAYGRSLCCRSSPSPSARCGQGSDPAPARVLLAHGPPTMCPPLFHLLLLYSFPPYRLSSLPGVRKMGCTKRRRSRRVVRWCAASLFSVPCDSGDKHHHRSRAVEYPSAPLDPPSHALLSCRFSAVDAASRQRIAVRALELLVE